MRSILIAALWAVSILPASAQRDDYKTIDFPSLDGLKITADIYLAHPQKAPFIVLCHQARWSRGEYREIVQELNRMGFNCLAIDQRSGGAVHQIKNQTFERAKKKKLGRRFIDARPDIIAALRFVRKHHAEGPVIAWGSSYSASLVLEIAGTEPELVDGVVAFAPGEYFARYGLSPTFVRDAAKKIKVPAFLTSARDETENWKAIYEAIPAKTKSSFLPQTRGQHGSRALWDVFEDSPDYWKALKPFLKKHFLPSKPTSRPN